MFLDDIYDPHIMVEAEQDYARKLYFDYEKEYRGTKLLSSPSPVVLYLGTWRMTDRHGVPKKFICGINLAYLEDKYELASVRQALPDILKVKNMKSRYRIGKNLLPDIFRRAYRTYNINNLATRPIRGRFYTLKSTQQDKEEARVNAEKDGLEWQSLDNQTKNQYLDKAIQKRDSEDEEDREQAEKEKEYIDKSMVKEPEPDGELEEPEPDEELEKDEKSEFEKRIEEPLQLKQSQKPKEPEPEFKPVLGPGLEPGPDEVEPSIQSPLESIPQGTVTPQKIDVREPSPEEPSES